MQGELGTGRGNASHTVTQMPAPCTMAASVGSGRSAILKLRCFPQTKCFVLWRTIRKAEVASRPALGLGGCCAVHARRAPQATDRSAGRTADLLARSHVCRSLRRSHATHSSGFSSRKALTVSRALMAARSCRVWLSACPADSLPPQPTAILDRAQPRSRSKPHTKANKIMCTGSPSADRSNRAVSRSTVTHK
jgi:hypothetical protein